MKLLFVPAALALAVSSTVASRAEPQPVEYVRVCDAFGTGFLYVPGTERCLNAETGEIRFATENGVVFTQSELAGRVSDLEADTAISNTLEDPDLIAGERFGVRVNWGNAGAQNAAGITGTAVITDGVFGEKGRIAASGAVGFTDGRVGGRAGMQFTW